MYKVQRDNGKVTVQDESNNVTTFEAKEDSYFIINGEPTKLALISDELLLRELANRETIEEARVRTEPPSNLDDPKS